MYQQNRKSHTQQIKDLNNKVEELTQALETSTNQPTLS